MNKIKYTSLFSITAMLIIAGCSDNSMDQESTSAELAPVTYYNQFMPCTVGPDYSPENMRKMIAEWNELEAMSDNLVWAGGYAPKGDNNGQDNGWWELQWTSKEAADAGWEVWMASEEAQAWDKKNNSILACDNSAVSSWTFNTPGVDSPDFDFSYFATETNPCNLNDGKTTEDLMAVAEKYNNWVAENTSAEAYFYGIYEALDDDAMFDFLWANFHQSFEGWEAGNTNFAEKGADMQASFNEVASCRAPDLYDSYEFRSLMSDAS